LIQAYNKDKGQIQTRTYLTDEIAKNKDGVRSLFNNKTFGRWAKDLKNPPSA
jgi:hypothetical protein